jgi:hypothetical protein
MTTPKQFLESFLQEKTAAWAQARPHLSAVHGKYFGEPLLRRTEHFMPHATVGAVVENVKQSGDVASAVVREHFSTADICKRYRLAASDDRWTIIGIDHQCFLCRGTGECGGSQCQKCDGDGWNDCTMAQSGATPNPA